MSEHATAAPADELRTEITDALVAIWARYAGEPPTAARTEIRDNVVTCVLIDAVSHYDAGLIQAQKQNPPSWASNRRDAAYKSEAAATVAGLMGRRVTSFISSHDRDTNAATEIFTLERRLFS
jgi:uncharacterized protein YbcI